MILFFKTTFFLGGLVPLFLGFFIYLKNSNNWLTRTYFGMSTCCAVWSLGFFMLIVSSDVRDAIFWRWFMEAGSIFIIAFWVHFINVLSNTVFKRKKQIIFVYFVSCLIWVINLGDLFGYHFFSKNMVSKGGFQFYPSASFGYTLYFIFFLLAASYSIYLLYVNLQQHKGELIYHQSKYLMVASILGFGGGGTTFFLTFNIDIIPYGVVFFSIYPIAIAYTVAKYNLFNIKIVATQILVSTLSILLLVRTVVADNQQEFAINASLFGVITVVGVFLIRSVSKEVLQREKIEKLANDLAHANERLTELDKLKSEFVSLATHQIRGPLAAIKGYASLMLEGDYGIVPRGLEKPIETVYESSKSLAVIVDDFLNVSRIEQGKMKYDYSVFDLCALVKETCSELKPSILKKGLELHIPNCPDPAMVRADIGKIKQVISNIIDNSVKYTPSGKIEIDLKVNDDLKKVTIKIADTGVGIKAETIPHLFKKFSRSEDASKVNILGTGLGLYVAKEMIMAQGGRIWVESPGEGKGSSFFVELGMV